MARLDPLLGRLGAGSGESLLLVPGQPPQLKGAAGTRPAGPTVLQAAQISALLEEISPESAMPPAGPGSRWRFDYRLGAEVFAVTAVATPEGWVASIAAPAAAEPPPAAPTPAGDDPGLGPPPGTAPAGLPPLRQLLAEVVELDGSDLHLSPAQVPRIRLHGDLRELNRYRAPRPDELMARLAEVLPERNRRELEETHDTDFAWEIESSRFRVNAFADRNGIGCVLRRIPHEIPSFEALGLPDSLRELALLPKGLVLVTGPTGSGKSTTLAALLDLVNRERWDHLITIEDPIEFVHPSKRCLVNQREVGIHTGSFKSALRAALREDPDIILVGEMRDLETIAIAIETAETGHLVFGTLHTTTAPSTVDRIVDQFPGDRQEQIRTMLAESLRAVIAQTLLRRSAGGRVAAYEILRCTPAVSNLIREGKTFQIPSAMQIGRAQGMMTMTDSLLELVRSKTVEPAEALRKAIDRDTLTKKLLDAGLLRPRPGAGAAPDAGTSAGS